MSESVTLLNKLRQYRRKGYGEGLPSVVDTIFVKLAENYVCSDCAQRRAIRSAVNDDTRLLLGFSDRLATVAARTKDRRLLFLALIAHSIEDFRHDNRENIIVLVLINHVAKKLGKDLAILVRKVAELSSEHSSRNLLEFLNRHSQINTLKAMRIIEEETAEGIDYRYI